MIVLAITTSTPRGGVALVDGEKILGRRIYEDERAHAERIFGELDLLLAETKVARADVGALACDVGPGSFTGTRVGLASAKGIALALESPLWPVVNLHAMAAAALARAPKPADDEPAFSSVIAAVNAKRGELFVAHYDAALATLRPPQHARREDTAELLQPWSSPGTLFCGHLLATLGTEPGEAHVAHPECDLPDPAWIGVLAARSIAAGEAAADLALVEPVYVRAPDAIANLPPSPVDWQPGDL